MKKQLFGPLLAFALVMPASAALNRGANAPDFKAPASIAGKSITFSLASALKKGPVVVYFYPAAFTGGCNVQARAFAENADKFAAARTTIVGVSGDSIQRLNAFSADPQYCGGKFPVASDPEGAIGKSYDLQARAMAPGKPAFNDSRGQPVDNKVLLERTTFVITPDRKIAARISTTEDNVKPADHAAKALEVVQNLAKSKR